MISAELNKILHFTITGMNIVIALILWKLCFARAKKSNQYMSKRLRFYFRICLHPHIFLIKLLSIITGIHFFIYQDYETTTYRILRMIIIFSASQIRYTFFFLVLSRITATVFYKSYAKYSRSDVALVVTIIVTYISSSIKGYIEFIRIFAEAKIYFYTIYFVIAEHTATIILCQLLYFVNQTKYEMLAYQITLDERHQIYENVKVLKTLWPMILIFSLIAPLGSLGVVAYKYLLGSAAPTSLFYLSYNISFIFMVIWMSNSSNNIQTSISIVGKNSFETNINSSGQIVSQQFTPGEQYFKELQKQWS